MVLLEGRAKRLAALMPPDFEAALILTEVSRFYLLDFDAHDAGTLLVLPDGMVYFIDSRYIESAQSRVKNAEVVLDEGALRQAADRVRQAGVKKLYLEDSIPVALSRRVEKLFDFVEIDINNTLSKTLRDMRKVKDEGEIARVRDAQAVTDACFAHILPFIKEGVRELDLALEMEFFMRKNGAGGIAFDTISVAGHNTSLPHGVPGENRVRPGDFITMDFGARCGGYCSDMTRTVALGRPGEEQRKLYDLVLRAHLAGIEAVRAGAACKAVDAAARDMLRDAGYGAYFGHGLGHSLGIEIHEEPRLSPKSEDTLQSGMLVTVEPGCYLPGRFGCRIEDTVLVTDTGCRPLPTSPKELIEL